VVGEGDWSWVGVLDELEVEEFDRLANFSDVSDLGGLSVIGDIDAPPMGTR
jgi:radical SAM superfamily enzyme YgiQ (UPF0313 family)